MVKYGVPASKKSFCYVTVEIQSFPCCALPVAGTELVWLKWGREPQTHLGSCATGRCLSCSSGWQVGVLEGDSLLSLPLCRSVNSDGYC